MNISKLFVAALVAIAINASAEESNLHPGQIAVAHPHLPTLNVSQMFPTQVNAKPNDAKPNDAKPGDNTPGTPAAAPTIALAGVTGVVQIKTAGGVMTVKAGEPVPAVPAGAEIIVVSGDANVTAGGATVKANAGDSFIVNVNGAGAADIAVTGGVVTVIGADGTSKEVAKGEGVVVAAAAAKPATPAAPAAKPAPAPESIPADAPADTTPSSTPPTSSPTQEAAVTPVSPSAP